MRKLSISHLLCCVVLAFALACSSDNTQDASEWSTFGHDVSHNKFSALTGIDTLNVARLKEVWRYEDTQDDGGVYFNP